MKNALDVSRRMELIGKPEKERTFVRGMFRTFYDEDGYFAKAVKISDSAGYVVDGKTYDGNGNIVEG